MHWLREGWQKEPLQAEELFDLVFDPDERNNLAADPAHAATLHQMQTRLNSWMHATNDPLLNGPVPLPPDGRSAPVNGISPKEMSTSNGQFS